MNSEREPFLQRIRQSLNRTKGQPMTQAAPVVDQRIARLVGEADDVLEVFVTQAAASGMHVHRCRADELEPTVLALLRAEGVKRMVMACEAGGMVEPLRETIGQTGIAVQEIGGRKGMDAQFDVDAGLTDVQAAFAETGTIICAGSAMHSRGPSLVPPLHLAVVRRNQVFADMLDYFANLSGKTDKALPSSIAFITGPSKTADIEGILITGVHGPGKVHVIVVEDA